VTRLSGVIPGGESPFEAPKSSATFASILRSVSSAHREAILHLHLNINSPFLFDGTCIGLHNAVPAPTQLRVGTDPNRRTMRPTRRSTVGESSYCRALNRLFPGRTSRDLCDLPPHPSYCHNKKTASTVIRRWFEVGVGSSVIGGRPLCTGNLSPHPSYCRN